MQNISLVFFTSLAQASVGMVLFIALLPSGAELSAAKSGPQGGPLRAPHGFALAVALVLFALGVLFSLLHLSDPLIAFYSITNVGTSWLSREILFMGLFGVSALALFFVGSRALGLVAGLFGLGLVYVMSRVYMGTAVEFWSDGSTLWTFLSTSLLLGSATLLSVRALRGGPAGILPLAIVAAAGLRLVFSLLQLLNGFEAAVGLNLLYMHIGGTALALVALFAAVQYGRAGEGAGRFVPCVLLSTALFWAAELCARIMFYQSTGSFTA